MKMNLEIKKKSRYWHRIWKLRGETYQRSADKLRERDEEELAQYHELRAKECFRRSVAFGS